VKISTSFSFADVLSFLPGSYINSQPNFLKFQLDSNAVALLFRTGSVVITGIKSPDKKLSAVRRCVELLRNAFQCSFPFKVTVDVRRVKIKTILAVCKLKGVRVCPYDMRRNAPFMFRWEPEICNAVIVSLDNVTLKLFPRTCSVVIFGKKFKQMISVFNKVNEYFHIHSQV
jgi:TATA-box binding protein (TBP) (component of TFIID and TFIIIB)